MLLFAALLVGGCSGDAEETAGAEASGAGGATAAGPAVATGASSVSSSSASSVASSSAGAGGAGGGSGAVVKLIAIGDTGEGNDEQRCVAEGMNQKCAEVGGCTAVMLNGDNFYNHGVVSVSDEQWMDKFELVYDKPNLNGLKFYAVLGNHDYGLTSTGDKDAQIDYSYLPAGERHSDKWTMPAAYYDVVLGGGVVHLFAIDTQDPQGAQKDDMAGRVSSSTAAWKIVFGHHMRFTSGDHQLDNQLLGQATGMFSLQQAIYCNADMYMSGHDHDRELIDKGQDTSCPNTYFAISGAGAKTNEPGFALPIGKSEYFDYDIEGYAYLELSEDSFLFEFYDMNPADCSVVPAPSFSKTIVK